ncbi:MAG TPA: enoyl-CoA hydratase-related protein, partial [Arenicellales bacterium]|nr:enoyl-CoA hydratase-related protein [Arenicellales bacterium]
MPKASLASSTPFMIAEIEDSIGWMTFNNPDRHNAVKVEMWEAIPQILDQFEADSAVKVVVLKGSGEKAFISGADISEFEQVRSSKAATKHYEDIADTATDRLYSCSKPTIAMIRGYCIGGG